MINKFLKLLLFCVLLSSCSKDRWVVIHKGILKDVQFTSSAGGFLSSSIHSATLKFEDGTVIYAQGYTKYSMFKLGAMTQVSKYTNRAITWLHIVPVERKNKE